MLGLVLVTACGRIGFGAVGDARGGDSGTADVAPDGPSRFGTFAGTGGGMALAVSGAANDLVVGGWLTSPTDLGGGTLPYVAGLDLFVAKYSEAGERRWARALGSTGDDFVNDVATDANEDIYRVGSMAGPIDFGGGLVSPSGDTDAYIASYTSTGTFRWAQRTTGATRSPSTRPAPSPRPACSPAPRIPAVARSSRAAGTMRTSLATRARAATAGNGGSAAAAAIRDGT